MLQKKRSFFKFFKKYLFYVDSVLSVIVHSRHKRKEAEMFQIDSKSRKSIYEQVIDNIKELIIRNVLPPQSRLPSVRELSKQLLINPNTVQKAYKELERQGYIYTSAGLGTFVSEIDTNVLDMQKYKDIIEHIRFYIEELYYIGLTDEDILRAVGEIIKERGEHLD